MSEQIPAAILTALAATVPDFILEVDRNGKILSINRTRPDHTHDDVVGTSLFDWLACSDQRVIQDALEGVFAGAAQIVTVMSLGRGDRATCYEIRLGPVVVQGEVVRSVCVARDIESNDASPMSHPPNAASSATASVDREQLLAAVARGLSHELKNPLTVIRLGAETAGLWMNDAAKRESVENMLRHIADAANRANQVIKRFSDSALWRPELQKLQVHELVDVLKLAISRAWPTAETAGVSLLETFPQSCEIPLDPVPLQQAICELLTNAVAASVRDGTVRISLEQRDGDARILVQDDGCGMDGETLARARDPFDFIRQHRQNGMSLKLSFVERVVRQHGGTLNITSRLGIATQAELILPAKLRESV